MLFRSRTVNFLTKKKNIESNPINGIKNDPGRDISARDAAKVLEKVKTSEDLNEKNANLAFKEEDMNNFKDLDTKKIKEIMDLLENSNLEEIKIESGDVRVTLNKKGPMAGMQNTGSLDLGRLKDMLALAEQSSGYRETSISEESGNAKNPSREENKD